jgi:hypothetical protein
MLCKQAKAFTPIFKMDIFAILINRGKNTRMKPLSPKQVGVRYSWNPTWTIIKKGI